MTTVRFPLLVRWGRVVAGVGWATSIFFNACGVAGGESWSARVEISTNLESKKFQDFIEQGSTLKKKFFQTLKI